MFSSDGEVPFAKSVCDNLSSKFGIDGVALRYAKVPLDRLIADSDSDRPVLWILLKHMGSTLKIDAAESASVPLLELEITSHSKPQETSLQIAKFCGLSSAETRESVQRAIFARRQARLVEDAQLHTESPYYEAAIARSYDHHLQISGDDIHDHHLKHIRKVGKVRDCYEGATKLALVTTDRQSGFDRMLAKVPFKGAVLNLTSAFWFERTEHIIPNHLLSVPHPNVSIVKKCKPFPIEFVVR